VSGGRYEKPDKPWGEKVITSKLDGRVVIMAQNPAGGAALGKRIYEALFGKPL
jgi:putative intracellular protease/amidase